MIGHANPVGGFAYWISPITSWYDLFRDPIHLILYTAFMVTTCGLFARMWIDISGNSARDLSRQLSEKDMQIKGMREDSMTKYLNHYIPTAAALGGVCIALLAVFADFIGAIGSGAGVIIAITIIYQMFEIFARERENIP